MSSTFATNTFNLENIPDLTKPTPNVCSNDKNKKKSQVKIPKVKLKYIRQKIHRHKDFPNYYRIYVHRTLRRYLKGEPLNKVLYPPIISVRGYQLHVKDLMTLLTPKTWLNDVIVQNYLSLLVHYCVKTKDMDTDFLNSYKRFGYDSVFRWFKKYELNNLNKIVVPINPGGVHWALFVIEIWEGKIYYFDSYSKQTFIKELKLIHEFLSRAIIDYIKYSGVQRTAPKNWIFIDGKSPIQKNTYDCGVFACMNARYFLLNDPPSKKFTQKNMPILRQIMGWELIKSRLVIF